MTDNRNKEFIRRHIGPSSSDQNKMLSYLGFNSLDEFIKKMAEAHKWYMNMISLTKIN